MTVGGATSFLHVEWPCPACGYDLRGHGDETRCPECGRDVHVSAAISESVVWADRRLLDLWSIAVLHVFGTICGSTSLAAIWMGQHVAAILGLASVVYVTSASVWFLTVLVGWVERIRAHKLYAVGGRRRERLRNWLAIDAALTLIWPAILFAALG